MSVFGKGRTKRSTPQKDRLLGKVVFKDRLTGKKTLEPLSHWSRNNTALESPKSAQFRYSEFGIRTRQPDKKTVCHKRVVVILEINEIGFFILL